MMSSVLFPMTGYKLNTSIYRQIARHYGLDQSGILAVLLRRLCYFFFDSEHPDTIEAMVAKILAGQPAMKSRRGSSGDDAVPADYLDEDPLVHSGRS